MDSLSPNIFVDDMNETITFYKSIGFQLVMTVPEEGNDFVWAMLSNGEVTVMFQTFSSLGEELPEMEWTPTSEPTTIVRRYFRKESVDKINQVFSFSFIYRTFHANEMILEETEAFKLSYFTYPHLRALFLLAGLEPVAEYGSFAKAPLDNNAEQMIFLLRKATGS